MSSVNTGLSVSDIVNVAVSIAPTAAAQRNFGSLLIMGDSAVINVQDRFRSYASAAAVAADFGGTAPETLAATIYFDQTPTPAQVYVGAWAQGATAGTLMGEVLSASQQAVSNFSGITTGSIALTIDGTPYSLTGINFSIDTNLNAVAATLTSAIAGPATVTWDAVNQQFVVKSATTGTASSVSVATPVGSGVDVSGLFGFTAAAGAYSVPGIAAETFASAVSTMANLSSAWYGVMVAATNMPADSDMVNAAAIVQALPISRIFGVTTQEASALNSTVTSDLASLLKAGGYRRTFCQYSSSSPYAAAAMFGNAFTVDFEGNSTTITLMFKQEGGVTAETLSETAAAALAAKNCNVFVNYNNGTAIIQHGVMADGTFFDIVHGTDWLQNDVQTAVYNTLYGARKIPQTDAGVDILLATVSNSLDQAVANGFVAPGVWTGPAIGSIVSGQTLSKGYYVYAPPISSQTAAARGARQAPVISAAIKLAGAIQSASVVLNVNS